MKIKNNELFNPNLVFTGDIELALSDYPVRSKNLEIYANAEVNAKNLNKKFIKDGFMYLLRGGRDGQETGFYSRTYANGDTISSLELDPNAVAYFQSMNGNTSFISATTDIYTAASFANKRIYVIKVPVEDVYTFYEVEGLMEFEYMIPDYIHSSEIVKSFRFDKLKQIFNYLTNEVGLEIIPEDLGTIKEDLMITDLERIKVGAQFNFGSSIFDDLLSENFEDAFLEARLPNAKPLGRSTEVLREVAIFTDAHGLLEPTEAILNDISKRGITEIYSLGDNIGLGPNPSEVISLLNEYNVTSIAGNYEEMIRLGYEPFMSYLKDTKIADANWTKSQLTDNQLKQINKYKSFINLDMAGKKIGLCHFANDIRCDFTDNNVWDYVEKFKMDCEDNSQFRYTNSKEQLMEFARALGIKTCLVHNAKSLQEGFGVIKSFIRKNKLTIENCPSLGGYLSYIKNQLFVCDGKILRAEDYPMIIQGHTHFACHVHDHVSDIYSVRAAGMGYEYGEENLSSYLILKEYIDRIDVEIVKVPFDRDRMENSINKSENQNKLIRLYTKTSSIRK